MLRSLLLPFLLAIFLSCSDSSKEVDPLFYQISEADSTRCMDEILSGILEDTSQVHRIKREIYFPDHIVCSPIRGFRIAMNSRGQVMISKKNDCDDVAEKTFDHFIGNRNLTESEKIACATDAHNPGFELPFYDSYSLNFINDMIKSAEAELSRIKMLDGVPPKIIEEHVAALDEWKARKKAIEIIGGTALTQKSPYEHVRFEYQRASSKSKEVLNQIAFAFYQMRNYECLRYFNETYLSLYDRAQRKQRKIDLVS